MRAQHPPSDVASTALRPAGTTRLKLVSPDRSYPPVGFAVPSPAGFVYLAVQSGPPRRPGPVVHRDRRREDATAAMRAYADVLSGNEAVREATMFRAVVVTPARAGMVQPDATLLVETDTSASAQALADSAQLAASLERLGASGARVEVLVARNARRIADVAHSQGRLYLFNHFVAHDEEIAVALWEHLAAWYQRETGLDNSMLLAPTEERRSTFNLVNHAAFDLSLPTLARRQFAKRSFFTYVRANLATNAVTAQPVLYRLTHRWSQPRVASALSAERASNQP